MTEENFAQQYARTVNGYNPYAMNPLISNQYLKDMNMKSASQKREDIEKMIGSPEYHEQSLRKLARFIYNTQMAYKRMVHYLADILTFDWYPVPINATEKDMQKATFKRDYDNVLGWFDKFNVKKEFRKAMLKMCSDDGYFTYLREDDEGDLFLQEMPIDHCIVDSSWKYGYLYSFDMTYFQQLGMDINGFPKEFKKYYKNVLDMQKNKTYYPNLRPEMRSGRWMYWQQINPKNGWVFKFHNQFAGLIPPFLGVFLDFMDLPALKDMQNAKSELEVYKIIMGTVPRNKDNKSGSRSDDFAINADTLGQFVEMVRGSLNKYVDFKAVPLEQLDMFEFDKAVDKESPVSKTLDNISSQTGIDRSLLNTDRPNVASLKLSKTVDAEFVSRLYSQFTDFATYHANKQSKKYKFKIIFEGTIHDQEERLDKYLKIADKGMILAPQIASAAGSNIKDFNASMALTKAMGFVDKLEVLPTSYTQSNDGNEGGRPKGKIETESAEVTETQGSNVDKEVGG